MKWQIENFLRMKSYLEGFATEINKDRYACYLELSAHEREPVHMHSIWDEKVNTEINQTGKNEDKNTGTLRDWWSTGKWEV